MHQLLPAPAEVDLFTAYAQPDAGVRVNFVSSLDGAATVDGRSDGLSGPGDKQVFRAMRTVTDVVLVGAGTVRTENYGPAKPTPDQQAWRRDHGLAAVPPVAVVSASLRLDPGSRLFTEAMAPRPIILTGPDAPEDRRAALAPVADVIVGESASEWLAHLAKRGLARVLCEGGPRLFGSLLAEDRVDELCLTLSPLLARQEAPSIADKAEDSVPRRLVLAHVLEDDGFLFLRYMARPR